jgi:hypothetical protein
LEESYSIPGIKKIKENSFKERDRRQHGKKERIGKNMKTKNIIIANTKGYRNEDT